MHRDLKPGNILIAADGPRVIDFGISRTTSGTVVTTAQTALGTPAYVSPEQAQGLPVGPASDVFSLGSVLAFAASGVSPFGGGEMFAVGFRVVHGEPDLTRVPAAVRLMIDACLAKDPAARPGLGRLIDMVAENSAAYPDVAPGKFWPDQVSAVLESGTFRPVLAPPTITSPPGPAPSKTTHAVQPRRYAPRRRTRGLVAGAPAGCCRSPSASRWPSRPGSRSRWPSAPRHSRRRSCPGQPAAPP